MKKYSPWMAWIAAVVLLWVVWIWGVFGNIQAKNSRLRAEENDLQVQEAKTLGLLASAPLIIAGIDSIRNELQETTGAFTGVDNLQRLPDELAGDGQRRRIDRVKVTLNLASVLGIPTAATIESCILDTLLVEITAQGKFTAIGGWLDEVEERADFLKWDRCRWEPGHQEGLISFAGMAQFRIIAESDAEQAIHGF